MYTYNAIVRKVYDGDTITVDIDLGLGVWKSGQTIRLANINTPEVRGDEKEAGLVSRDILREKILNKKIIITTFKDKKGKYGRYIGEIFIDENTLNENITITTRTNINEWLVENGFAKYKEY